MTLVNHAPLSKPCLREPYPQFWRLSLMLHSLPNNLMQYLTPSLTHPQPRKKGRAKETCVRRHRITYTCKAIRRGPAHPKAVVQTLLLVCSLQGHMQCLAPRVRSASATWRVFTHIYLPSVIRLSFLSTLVRALLYMILLLATPFSPCSVLLKFAPSLLSCRWMRTNWCSVYRALCT